MKMIARIGSATCLGRKGIDLACFATTSSGMWRACTRSIWVDHVRAAQMPRQQLYGLEILDAGRCVDNCVL
jgi:hypothetical protein